MASEEARREKASRKLTKRPRESRKVSLDIPERFKDGDDAHEDVTAPKRKDTMSMNQSIFSMIARAGQPSQTDLGMMQDADSGDSGDESKPNIPYHSLDGAARLSRLSTANDFQGSLDDADNTRASTSKHHRARSENKLLRSLPKLSMKSRKEKSSADAQMSSSQFLPPRSTEISSPGASEDEPRFSSRKTNTMVDQAAQREKPHPEATRSRHGTTVNSLKAKASMTLAQRLQQIFDFEGLEEVISEYPCWLLQSILLQGYMYITQKHICFYAYIPKKHHDVSKTGYLSKRGTTKSNRYWFVLRGDVLSYFTSPADLYFPRNRINLQYAISAEVLELKDKDKEDTAFMVLTDERTYHFKADSAASAKEWVRAIQKVIFRTHNEGNSVKISLPIQNVLEIEESSILDFADTVKVKVIDNDETYAIDDYFFSFFSHGQDALNVLRIMVNDNDNHHVAVAHPGSSSATPVRQSISIDRVSASGQDSPAEAPVIRENVRATLSPLPGPTVGSSRPSMESRRSSMEVSRRSFDVRRSMDHSRTLRRPSHEVRRSFSGNRNDPTSRNRTGDKSPLSAKPDSSDSTTNSFDPGTESSAAIQSINDTNASASQILDRSDVFQGPTIHRSEVMALDSSVDRLTRDSQDTARSNARSKDSRNSPAIPHAKQRNRVDPLSPISPSGMEEDNDHNQQSSHVSGSSSALHDFVGAAAYPLQKASGLAGFIRTRSKKMSNLLATESMGYYEKVSGMWAGGRKHYNTVDALDPDDQVQGVEEDEDAAKAAEHFRDHFALPESEQLQSSFFCYLQRVLPIYGKIYISSHYFCFRGLMPGTKTKIILPFKDIETVKKEKSFRFGYHGIVVIIRGHEEIFFDFSRTDYRDDCTVTLLRILENSRYMEDIESASSDDNSQERAAKAEHDLLQEAREAVEKTEKMNMSQILRNTEHGRIPLIFDDPTASIVDFKPAGSLRVICLTIGSRGDVQPYIALCKALLEEGHRPCIATHKEFEPWIRKHGIDFAPVGGDPAELMRVCVEYGMFTLSFMKEVHYKFRGWLDDLCSSAWKACQGADVLIESPSAMAGIHIAEALEIPYFRAFTMPWTRTRTYPHAFSVTDKKMGGGYNTISYVTFDTIFWHAIASQVNSWRRRELGLQKTTLNQLQQNSRPFLYNFSPLVVPPPLDWPDWIRVTGYWFLDESDGWAPPPELLAFISKARQDRKKIVYVGFGSIIIDDPAALTKTVVDSVLKADVRCILSKGWSDRLGKKDASKPEVPLPDDIYQIQAAPHDWLFKQIDAAVHHGGSGTTGASLRAGLPTIIKPFFGDQFFYAQRVEDLGVGVYMRKVNTSVFSRALWEATNSQRMIVKAKYLGQEIRKESGVQTAIQTIYRELDRAKMLVKRRDKQVKDEFDEDWTWVDEEEEVEINPQVTIGPSVSGMRQAPTDSGLASGGLALGSMVLRGASSSRGKSPH